MHQDQFQYLRACQLQVALTESKLDLAKGYFVKETLSQHLLHLKQLNPA